jgi:phage-related protein
MRYEVILFETKTHQPVHKFISSLQEETVAKIIQEIDLLEEFGANIGMPHVKKINKYLYELRIKDQEQVRLLFCQITNKIYILHGFKKKRQKILTKEIEIAQKRLTYI